MIIIGIYILRALTARKAEAEAKADAAKAEEAKAAEVKEMKKDPSAKKESAMDLMKEREKKDFLETDDSYTISNDL